MKHSSSMVRSVSQPAPSRPRCSRSNFGHFDSQAYRKHASAQTSIAVSSPMPHSIPAPPAKKNMTAIDTCCTCLTDQGSPGAEPNRSIQVFVAPYSQMTAHSIISADGAASRQVPATFDFLFQAQPSSAQAPQYLPNVSRPYQKNIDPLIVCAMQPFYDRT